jgi:vacuolar protein sorting-associated protein 54
MSIVPHTAISRNILTDRNRMLRDAEYFKAKIGGLDGAGDAGDYIVKLVKEKNVPKLKVSSESKTELVTNGKSSSEGSVSNGNGTRTEN